LIRRNGFVQCHLDGRSRIPFLYYASCTMGRYSQLDTPAMFSQWSTLAALRAALPVDSLSPLFSICVPPTYFNPPSVRGLRGSQGIAHLGATLWLIPRIIAFHLPEKGPLIFLHCELWFLTFSYFSLFSRKCPEAPVSASSFLFFVPFRGWFAPLLPVASQCSTTPLRREMRDHSPRLA